MYCTKCGVQIAPGAAFCTICGTRIESAARPPTAPPTYIPPRYPTPPPKSAKPIVLIVVIILVVGMLVGAGVGYYYLLGSGHVGDCVEEWAHQPLTRKEGWTRGECEAFCSSGVNPNHLACYFEPY